MQHITLIYHQLMELQGNYTFLKKTSENHRDWVVKRVFLISKSVSIIYAQNGYVGQYFYLFKDAMSENEQHQLAILLR